MNTTNFHPIFWYSYKCLHIYWFASWNNADRAHCEVHICLSFDELCLERRALCLWGRADSQPHHVGKPCTTLLLQSYSCYHDFTIPNTMLNGSGICRENNSSTQIIIPTVKSSVAGFLNIEKLVWGISTPKYGIIHCRLKTAILFGRILTSATGQTQKPNLPTWWGRLFIFIPREILSKHDLKEIQQALFNTEQHCSSEGMILMSVIVTKCGKEQSLDHPR